MTNTFFSLEKVWLHTNGRDMVAKVWDIKRCSSVPCHLCHSPKVPTNKPRKKWKQKQTNFVCSSTEHQIPSASCNTIKTMKMRGQLGWCLLEKPWNVLIRLTYTPVVHLNLLCKIQAWRLYKLLFCSKNRPRKLSTTAKFSARSITHGRGLTHSRTHLNHL